jgi:1,4-dihydroxy-2-naphthoate octaprenyltransferase
MANVQLDMLARRERTRVVRNWCVGLGLVLCAGVVIPVTTITNPQAWAPTGGLRFFVAPFFTGGWFAWSLFGCGAVLLIVAAVLTFRKEVP